jgi:hypothetical protein
LTAVLPKQINELRLVILFEEQPAGDGKQPTIRALAEWPKQ